MIVRSTQVMLCVLHTSQSFCVLHAIDSHLLLEKDQGIQRKSTPAQHDKCMDMKKIILCTPTPDDIFIEPTECQTR